MPIYWLSISMFHPQSMKTLKTTFYPNVHQYFHECPYRYRYFQECPHQYKLSIFSRMASSMLSKTFDISVINIWNTPTRRGRGGGSHGDGQKSNSHNLMLISWYIWYIWSWYPLDHHHWMFLCSKIRPTPAQAQGGKRKAVLQTYI